MKKFLIIILIIPTLTHAQIFFGTRSYSENVNYNDLETEEHLYSFVFQGNQFLEIDNMYFLSSLEAGVLRHFSKLGVGALTGLDIYSSAAIIPINGKIHFVINKIETDYRKSNIYIFCSAGPTYIKNINGATSYDKWDGYNLKFGMGYNIVSMFPNTTYELMYKKQKFKDDPDIIFLGIGVSAWLPLSYKKNSKK